MQKALFYEVNTSLKPGLVDRLHNGSHKDMRLSTFINQRLQSHGLLLPMCKRRAVLRLLQKGTSTAVSKASRYWKTG